MYASSSLTSTIYTSDARFILSGSDDGNVRLWKAHASSKLGVLTTRVRLTAGRAWVAERDGEVAGYLLAAVVDGCAHVEQVSVDPAHARRRIGAALVDHLAVTP